MRRRGKKERFTHWRIGNGNSYGVFRFATWCDVIAWLGSSFPIHRLTYTHTQHTIKRTKIRFSATLFHRYKFQKKKKNIWTTENKHNLCQSLTQSMGNSDEKIFRLFLSFSIGIAFHLQWQALFFCYLYYVNNFFLLVYVSWYQCSFVELAAQQLCP